MRKWSMIMLALALLLIPSAAGAQELASLFSAVSAAADEGLAQGAAAAIAAMDRELTVEMTAEAPRIEEGKPIRLTVRAGNPLPQETAVSFKLMLPDRLTSSPDTAWEATLAPARYDGESGALIPSETVFTREIALAPGGGSETAAIVCEMQMGTRFYRTQADLALCVPDVAVTAALDGGEGGRALPGDRLVYTLEVANSGTAPKDVAVELTLPEGMETEESLPNGFEKAGHMLRGTVRAEAAAAGAPSCVRISVPVRIAQDILEGDADAMRLISGTLRADGKHVALPRIQVCGPRISARLTAQHDALEAGAQTKLGIVVVNSGLAPADVQVSCVLPEGLTLAEPEEDEKRGKQAKQEKEAKKAGKTEHTQQAATPAEAIAQLPPEDGDGLTASVQAGAAAPAMTREGRTLVFSLRMDAAADKGGSIAGATQVIEIPVRATEAQEQLGERLMGAALSWRVDDGDAQLGDALAMRVYKPKFLGLTDGEWCSVICAGVLMLLLVGSLYAAMRGDKSKEEYCFD